MKNSNNDFIDSYNDIKRYLIKNSGLSKDTYFDDLLDKVPYKTKCSKRIWKSNRPNGL